MGLSSKQVINRDGLDWSQTLLQQSHIDNHHHQKPPSTMRRQHQNQHQNQQQSEPLKCPRCDSTNTKFCYYNNYNRSQPRHFCRACKRHWTKGGTLRNVPVGGGRKNKRSNKKSSSAAAATAAAAATTATSTAATSTAATTDVIIGTADSRLNSSMVFQAQQPIRKNINILPNNNFPLINGDCHDEKSISEILSEAVLIRPPSLNMIGSDWDNKSFLTTTNTMSSASTTSAKSFFSNSSLQANFPPNQGLQCFQAFSSSTSSPFESSLSSISNSFQTSNVVCDYAEDQFKIMGETTVSSSCAVQPPWQAPAAAAAAAAVSNGKDLPNYWNWEDIDTLVSADHINLPWDDSPDDLIKP